MKNAILAMGLIFIISCTLTPDPASPEESAYLKAVMDMPLVFAVPKDYSGEVWGRIQSWIGRYSSMKMQTISDYVIETYNPGDGDVDFGYSAVRTIIGDDVEFEINCVCGNMFSGKEANINAHILAYFAYSGEVNPKFITKNP